MCSIIFNLFLYRFKIHCFWVFDEASFFFDDLCSFPKALHSRLYIDMSQWERTCLPMWEMPSDAGFDSSVRKSSRSRKWQPDPVFFPGKFRRQRTLLGYSPWGLKDTDTIEHAHTHTHTHTHTTTLLINKYTKWVIFICVVKKHPYYSNSLLSQ